MSSRFVNPFTDLGFKIIFGQPASKALLIILLNEFYLEIPMNERFLLF